jgi:pyruvate dehydrogenase E2 component (dihydrolipoamide acetyltransferase)
MSGAGSGNRGLPPVPSYDFSLFGPVEKRPLSNVRKVVARRMFASWVNLPQVTQFDQVDITDLEALRAHLKVQAEQQGARLTLLAFIVKAAALALKAFPEFNASLDENCETLILKKYCHIAFAADTPEGLLAPVIKDAGKKSLLELARDIQRLSEKARAGKLAFSDIEGGCFSVSNLGALGGTGFTPVVNAPELAVLGVGRAAMTVVDRDGRHVSRLMLPVSLTYDHRAIDGAAGGRFLKFVCDALASPSGLADLL